MPDDFFSLHLMFHPAAAYIPASQRDVEKVFVLFCILMLNTFLLVFVSAETTKMGKTLFSNECTQAWSKLYYYISGQAQPTLRTHIHFIQRFNIDGRAVSADV